MAESLAALGVGATFIGLAVYEHYPIFGLLMAIATLVFLLSLPGKLCEAPEIEKTNLRTKREEKEYGS
jgi:hypothetical protein